jgi:hypothetical protein
LMASINIAAQCYNIFLTDNVTRFDTFALTRAVLIMITEDVNWTSRLSILCLFRCLNRWCFGVLWFNKPWRSLCYTVRETKRDAGPKHVCDGKLRHPHKFSGPIYVDDGIFRHRHVLVHASRLD